MRIKETESVLEKSVGQIVSINCHMQSYMSNYQDMMYAGKNDSNLHLFIKSLNEFADGTESFRGIYILSGARYIGLNNSGNSFSVYNSHSQWTGRNMSFDSDEFLRIKKLWDARLNEEEN